jgi:hypothetical protein
MGQALHPMARAFLDAEQPNVYVAGDVGRKELTVCTHNVHKLESTCVSTRPQFSVLRYESVIHEFDPHFK